MQLSFNLDLKDSIMQKKKSNTKLIFLKKITINIHIHSEINLVNSN
jgi:hypothetical protein